MPNTRSQGNPLLPLNPEINQLFRRMDDIREHEDMEDDGMDNENPPPRNHIPRPREYNEEEYEQRQPGNDRQRQRGYNDDAYGWNQYRLNPMAMDVTGSIVLPPLPPDTKFALTSGLLQMLNNRGLFAGLASEDPHRHLQNVVFVCKSAMGTPNISMDAIGLRVFPLSLTGNAAVWLSELPPGMITSWAELQQVFLEKYFPRAKKLKLKDQINNFHQLPGESIGATWERFTKYLRMVPDHKIVDDSLVEIFYRALDENSKAVADTIMGGVFIDQPFQYIAQRMERVVKTNRAWGQNERDAVKGYGATTSNRGQDRTNEEIMEQLAQLRTSMSLVLKQGQASAHVVTQQPQLPQPYDDQFFDEEACFINDQIGRAHV